MCFFFSGVLIAPACKERQLKGTYRDSFIADKIVPRKIPVKWSDLQKLCMIYDKKWFQVLSLNYHSKAGNMAVILDINAIILSSFSL